MGTFYGHCETLRGFFDSSNRESRWSCFTGSARLMPLLAWICDDANFMVHYVITPFQTPSAGPTEATNSVSIAV